MPTPESVIAAELTSTRTARGPWALARDITRALIRAGLIPEETAQ